MGQRVSGPAGQRASGLVDGHGAVRQRTHGRQQLVRAPRRFHVHALRRARARARAAHAAHAAHAHAPHARAHCTEQHWLDIALHYIALQASYCTDTTLTSQTVFQMGTVDGVSVAKYQPDQ